MKGKHFDIDHDQLLLVVHYNPDTGTFTRLQDAHGGRWAAGERIGWKSSGHRNIKLTIDGVALETSASRLAWFYMNQMWPAGEVLHVNGDGMDDRWSNLCLKSEFYNNELTQEKLRLLAHYDAETGAMTCRRRRKNKNVGDHVGYINDDGYWVADFFGHPYRVHRLAWLYVYGVMPVKELDHIDGNPSNNKIANLREVNRLENMSNIKRPKTNKSGYKGVSWHAAGKCWQVHIKHDGVNHYLGHFRCPIEGHQAYKEAEQRLRGKFARVED